jgi:Transposase
MERRKFTREFKLEAVRLIKERGVSYAQASLDFGVHQSQLRSWVKARCFRGPLPGTISGDSPCLQNPKLWRCYRSSPQRILKVSFFLSFSTIKFMFERSDLGSNFFNHFCACRH